jgi:hypothetical protein
VVVAMTADIAAPGCVPLPAAGRLPRALAALAALRRRGLHFRLRCLILGHEDAFARQPDRLMLRCAACGRETAGWPIGPGASTAAASTRHATPFSRAAVVAPEVRVRPWGLGMWRARADARDRERQRMVLAAARAAERRNDDVAPPAPRADDGATRRRPGEPQPDRLAEAARRGRAGLGDYSRTADGSAPASPVKPQVRWVPSQNGLRDEWPQRHSATGRRSIM